MAPGDAAAAVTAASEDARNSRLLKTVARMAVLHGVSLFGRKASEVYFNKYSLLL
jgi:hypothetical protein